MGVLVPPEKPLSPPPPPRSSTQELGPKLAQKSAAVDAALGNSWLSSAEPGLDQGSSHSQGSTQRSQSYQSVSSFETEHSRCCTIWAPPAWARTKSVPHLRLYS